MKFFIFWLICGVLSFLLGMYMDYKKGIPFKLDREICMGFLTQTAFGLISLVCMGWEFFTSTKYGRQYWWL